MSNAIGYRDLWVEKNYLKSFVAGIINRFGDSIDALAFAWMVYEITGARAWSAVIFGLNALPTILFMPFAGVLVERMDKRRVMVFADLGRAALVTSIAVLYALGVAQAWMLACSTFLMSTLEAFRIPAGMAIYPQIVPREKYTAATSLSQMANGIAVLLGTGAFGFITAGFGLQGAMAVNAATFCISAALIFRIRLERHEKPIEPLAIAPFFRDLREGLSYFYGKKLLFLICMVGSGISALFVPLNALLAPYVQESLGQGEYALSLIQGAVMLGTMLGSAVFPSLGRRFGRVFLFTLGGLVCAVGYGVLAAAPLIPSVLVLLAALTLYSFILGGGSALINVIVSVVFMEQVDSAYLGRVSGLFNAIASALVPLTSFAVAAGAVYVRSEAIFIVSGVLAALLFLLLARSKLFKGIEMKQQEAEQV